MALAEIQEYAALVDEFGSVSYTINGQKSTREDYMAITASRIADALEDLADMGKAMLAPQGGAVPPGPPSAPGPGTGMFGG